MKKINKIFTIILPIVLLLIACIGEKNNYPKNTIDDVDKISVEEEESNKIDFEPDPWGVWNEHPFSQYARITTFSTGKYYEEFPALYIVKHCIEGIPLKEKYDFPAFIIPGEYIQIESYKPTQYGFIFNLIGNGFKPISGNTIFQDNTRNQVRMYFNSPDECYFKYDSLVDENGFHLSYFPKEDVIYRRLRVQ